MALLEDLLSPEQTEKFKALRSVLPDQNLLPPKASESAKVFEAAGAIPPNETAEEIVKRLSVPGKSAADSASVFEKGYQQLFEKQLAEDARLVGKNAAQRIVDAAALPGKSAADSAKVFADAVPTDVPRNVAKEFLDGSLFPKKLAEDIVATQSIPGKTAEAAAEVLAPKQLPAVLGERGLVAVGNGAQETARAASKAIPLQNWGSDGVIEMADNSWRHVPGGGLPAVVEKAGLPAVIETPAAPSLISKLAPVAKGALKVGGKTLGAYGMIDSLYGELADPRDIPSTPVPGWPGYTANGPDITPPAPPRNPDLPGPMNADGSFGAGAPGGGSADDGKSLFERVSDAYKRHEPELTAPTAPAAGRVLAKAPAAAAPPTVTPAAAPQDSGAKKPSLLDQLALAKSEMSDAQDRAAMNRLIAGIARAGGQLSHAITGAKGPMNDAGFKTLDENAGQPVKDVQDRQAANLKDLELEKNAVTLQLVRDQNDAGSAISQAAREFALKQGYKVSENTTYSQLEKMLPLYEKENLAKIAAETNRLRAAELRAYKEQESERKAKQHLERAKERAQGRLGSDPVYKEAQQQGMALNQVSELLEMAGSGNTVAMAALGPKMARAMGEKGVLTEQDVTRYVQSGALDRKIADKINRWRTGAPMDATLDELRQIASVLRGQYKTQVQPVYDKHANWFSRNYGIPLSDAYYILDAAMPSDFENRGVYNESQGKAANNKAPDGAAAAIERSKAPVAPGIPFSHDAIAAELAKRKKQ